MPASIVAQIDTEFWFVAPNLTEGHGDAPVLLRFTAFENDASVTITQPANNSWNPISIQVPAGQSRSVDLTARLLLLENTPALTPLNKGVFIQSNQPVTAYYEVNHTFNPDIFALKGRNALGKEFLIPAQNYFSNAGGLFPPARSAFDIVAVEDDTHIRITPSATVGGHISGSTFEVVLQKGQTYSVEAPDLDRNLQLTGSRVTSDQLIAITLKHDSNLYSECYDLAGDQLVPINVLGTEYIVVKGFLDGGDHVFVMATEDGTSITVDGANNGTSTNRADLATGEVYHFNLQNSTAHILSSAPVYVVHITGFGCETGLALLPKLECTGSVSVSFNRSTEENFGLILITKKGNEDAFTVTPNRPITADLFEEVPGTDGRYVAARVNLTNPIGANQGFQISNSKGFFHLGTINGGDRSGTRYGYFSDFKSLKLIADATKICLGSTMQLMVTGSDTYDWFGSPEVEGKTSSSVTVQPDTTTNYGVIGEDLASGCLDTAYLELEVFKWARPSLDISPTCAGINVSLIYTDTQPLESLTWVFEKDTFRTDGKDTFQIAWDDPGLRTLKLFAANPAGCISDTAFSLDVGGVLLELDSVYSIVLGETLPSETQVKDGAIQGATIEWSPRSGLSCFDCLNPIFSPEQSTDYILTVTDTLGCVSQYFARVNVDPPFYIPNAFSPNNDGNNDVFEIYDGRITVDEFIVANRWGQIVQRSSQAIWDGRINGKIAEPGVYVFYLRGVQSESGRDFSASGSITLIR
ncbi:MAG: gliding motility-associated C-terminal domain-containing protein [Saprospiraceae bacterium]|nr:gliding motility-associated C-terminal domain-containing protein [Saprospiraceae bacterium]